MQNFAYIYQKGRLKINNGSSVLTKLEKEQLIEAKNIAFIHIGKYIYKQRTKMNDLENKHQQQKKKKSKLSH